MKKMPHVRGGGEVMKCNYCKGEMERRLATEERPYSYKHSGLDGLLLYGIEIYSCAKCQGETPIIPRVTELYAVVADGIIRKGSALTGNEIRFLRKHAGLPAQKFAHLIGVTPEHLSRVENGHTKTLGKGTDRLVRALALMVKDGADARGTLLEIADDLERAAKSGKKVSREAQLWTLSSKKRWEQYRRTG
jgi:transcriptional regulator with XRE-family HTH domain